MSFNPHITTKELNELAASHELVVQHDCGGYRLTRQTCGGVRYVFPQGGICPTVARLACYIFLLGMDYQRSINNEDTKTIETKTEV